MTLVSQKSGLNRGIKGNSKTYRNMEKQWSTALKNGHDVSYKIDGKLFNRHFKN